MEPKVSIIIACYNDPYVEEAVEMASKQDYKNKEIVLVNDGSNKAITSLIERLKKKTSIVLSQTNKGQSVARNNGITHSSGEYILNWDSDDYFEPSFCSRAVELMESNGDIKIVTSHVRRFNEKGTIDIFKPRGGSLKNFLFYNSATGSSMYRKKDWKACGGYEEEIPILGFEDWEFYIQLLKKGGHAFIIPETLFHYRKRFNSTTEKIKAQKAEKFRQIILKHKDLYISNFEDLIMHLTSRIEMAENECIRRENSNDYKIGSLILKPFRNLKSRLK